MSFSGVKYTSIQQMIEENNSDPVMFLRHELQARRWTQRQTAKILGVTESVVSKIINRKKTLSLNQALILSAIFKCDVTKLIKIKPEVRKKINAALKRAEKLAA